MKSLQVLHLVLQDRFFLQSNLSEVACSAGGGRAWFSTCRRSCKRFLIHGSVLFTFILDISLDSTLVLRLGLQETYSLHTCFTKSFFENKKLLNLTMFRREMPQWTIYFKFLQQSSALCIYRSDQATAAVPFVLSFTGEASVEGRTAHVPQGSG